MTDTMGLSRAAALFGGMAAITAAVTWAAPAKADAGALAFYQQRSAAEAKRSCCEPRARRGRKAGVAPSAPVPSGVTIPRPRGYIRGRLTCAKNVGMALNQRGVSGTGSALAKSYLGWGYRTSSPVAGGVAVYGRRGGGHVKIIAGNGMCWNPSSSRQAWVLVPCARRGLIAYRAPASRLASAD